MDNEIKILIERFMAGLTSIEEEDRLAEYFRTHDVDDSLREYKEMFAWFDRGMPLNDTSAPLPAGNNNADDTEVAGMRRSKTQLRVLYIVAAAAAAVLLLIVTLPRNHSAQTVRTAAMSEPQTVRPVPAPADTVIADTAMTMPPKRKKPRRKPRRDMYKPMPPKTYIARNEQDSANKAAERMVEEQIAETKRRQDEMLDRLFNEYKRIELSMDAYITAYENYEEETRCY